MTVSTTPKYPSKMPSAIFLDSGGVINDNAKRAPQWLRYLGEFFPTTPLSGTPLVWAHANAQLIRPFFSRWYEYMAQATDLAAQAQTKAIEEKIQDRARIESGQDRSLNVCWIFERLHLLIWIKEMCRVAGPSVEGLDEVVSQLTEEDLFQIARSAHVYVIERVKAAYPGAVDTIRQLSEDRHGLVASSPSSSVWTYKLCSSSGDSSEDLEHIFKGLGVLECFDEVFGSDKVNCLKTSPAYFEKVFARVGVRPVVRDALTGGVVAVDGVSEFATADEVLVLDDSSKALKWARATGARTVLVRSIDEPLDLSLEENRHVDYQIKALSELPGLLESWKAHLYSS
ncbi:hypothetical protein EDD11_010291 [Mortierella claussenii]|nr:hypothetical protein EDD11_010291 [Mortierella claussenii]